MSEVRLKVRTPMERLEYWAGYLEKKGLEGAPLDKTVLLGAAFGIREAAKELVPPAPLFTPEEIETVLGVAANIQADCLADSWETPELCARHEKEYKTLERIAEKMSAPSEKP